MGLKFLDIHANREQKFRKSGRANGSVCKFPDLGTVKSILKYPWGFDVKKCGQHHSQCLLE